MGTYVISILLLATAIAIVIGARLKATKAAGEPFLSTNDIDLASELRLCIRTTAMLALLLVLTFIGFFVASLNIFVGLIFWVLPVLVFCALCVAMVVAPEDSWIDKILWGDPTRTPATTGIGKKAQRWSFVGLVAFMLVIWAIAGLVHSAENAYRNNATGKPPAATAPATTAPAAASPSPSASPKASPSPAAPMPSAPKPTASVDPNCGIPVAAAITDKPYDLTVTKSPLMVCNKTTGGWAPAPVPNGTVLHVTQFVQPGDGYEYDLADVDGQQVWSRNVLDK